MSYIFLFKVISALFLSISQVRSECQIPKASEVGTVLFNPTDVSRQCWSADEIAILTSRMILEDVLPEATNLVIDNNKSVDELILYFKQIVDTIRQNAHGRSKHLMLLALTDLLGGYLHFAVLPIARKGYYSGVIDYIYMEKLIQVYEEIKWFLRTNGQGWAHPMDTTNIQPQIQVIDLDNDIMVKDNKSCCHKLIYYDHEPVKSKRSVSTTDIARKKREDKELTVYFPLPFFDSKIYPSSIVVPLKRYALRNIESKKASYLVMKYFMAAHHCLEFLKASIHAKKQFRNKLFGWIDKEVMPKLQDDKFYAAFGGILRVRETLRSLGATGNTTCPTMDEGEQEVGTLPAKRSSWGRILFIIMLITIVAWFIIGTCFICYRMRTGSSGKFDGKSKRTTSSSTLGSSSKWSSMLSSSKSRTSDTCKCCSSPAEYLSSTDSAQTIGRGKAKSKSSPCVCTSDGPAIIDTKHSMKVLPSIAEMSENNSSMMPDSLNKSRQVSRRISFAENESPLSSSDAERPVKTKMRMCIPRGSPYAQKIGAMPCPKYSDKETSLSSSMTRTTAMEGTQIDQEDIDQCLCAYADDPTIIKLVEEELNKSASTKEEISEGQQEDTLKSFQESRVEQVNYAYDNVCACHTSLSGKYNVHLKSKEKPYIFGYDFHSSSCSSEDSDDTDTRN